MRKRVRTPSQNVDGSSTASAPVPPASRPRQIVVGLLIDPVYAHGRGILRGILTYGLEHDWAYQKAGDWWFQSQLTVAEWHPDGVIGSIHNSAMADLVAGFSVPLVNISSAGSGISRPSVLCDNVLIGRMAADHFLDQGLRNLAFVGSGYAGWSRERRLGFAERCIERDANLHVYAEPDYSADTPARRDELTQHLQHWLKRLPKPIGVFCANDNLAERVIHAARHAGQHVPEHIAILGADNDELAVEMTMPALSSIDINARRIGYEAAALLHRLLRGQPAPAAPIRIPPIAVVARRSSDVLALPDPDVTLAVRFIREHAASPTTVEDVLTAVPLSRRPLEKRFRAVLGRSILDEIHRVHVDRAGQLLAGTDLPMPAVAQASGFSTYTRLGIVFRKLTGKSPSEHRQLARLTKR